MGNMEDIKKRSSCLTTFLVLFVLNILSPIQISFLKIVSANEETVLQQCPSSDPKFDRTRQKSHEQVSVIFQSEAEYDLNYYWVNSAGKEVLLNVLGAHARRRFMSYAGHIFRVRSLRGNKRIHAEVEVPDDSKSFQVNVQPCGNTSIDQLLWDPNRDKEFEGLLVPNPWECEGEDSSSWSCVHHVSKEEESARDPSLWGFAPGESRRKVGQVDDTSYTRHIPSMIRVTDGPGILLMNQTEYMRKSLFEWFEKERVNLKDHGVVPGGYTNTHKIGIQKLSLDLYPAMHSIIVAEMRQVLQWWTGLRLKHTSTFGLREYKRGSMLINHVDRMDTHIASAVIQVSQDNIDEGGGWPLEVILPAGCTTTEPEECHRTEIYMQPGQMALYEGGKIMHGRPMRLRGEAFGNVFSHFSPIDWNGPDRSGHEQRKARRKSSHDEL